MSNFKLIQKLSMTEQFAIAKRLGSHTILPFVDMMLAGEQNNVSLVAALIMALNKMSDEDANFVVNTCISKLYDVSTQPPAAVYRNGQIMFDDLGLTEILNFTSEIILRDMRDFLNTVLPRLQTQAIVTE